MQFNGANVNEQMSVSANGHRVRFFRDVANITMDMNRIEDLNVRALGGADTLTVNDLSGTDLKKRECRSEPERWWWRRRRRHGDR